MYETTIDVVSRTIRPTTRAGDEFFGLTRLSATTAAPLRRLDAEHAAQVEGFRWVSHDGSRAVGLDLRPGTSTYQPDDHLLRSIPDPGVRLQPVDLEARIARW